jgi:UDP-N-acetylmuramoyl-L-alanyl-D-glutamate--2,6-diaminopimelate ligase
MQEFLENLKIRQWAMKALAKAHFWGNPSAKLKIVGVTGTNGKTTTATLLYRIATALGYKAGLVSTVENIIPAAIAGQVGEVRKTIYTTPESVSLNKLLNEMAEKGCEYVFMEVSSHGMDQGRVAGINFTGGIFTNLTHDHLDYHKNMENYFEAKKKFFQMLPKDAFALSNADDEYGKKMLEGIKAHPFSYGFQLCQSQRDTLTKKQMSKCLFDTPLFFGEIKKQDFNGLELFFNGEEIRSRLLGKFNAYNLLAVWSACKLLGFDMEKPARTELLPARSGGVNKILENIEPPRGRFEHFTSPQGVLIVVDYAHTPDALENVLQTIKEIKSQNNRIISVFGCGGDRDPTKRSKMGRIGAEMSDIAIFTSDNPRGEDPEKIITQMKADLAPDMLEKVKSISDRRQAIKQAVTLAQAGDIILCAGKGHETYQEIKGVKNHFDDMEEFKKAILQFVRIIE